MEFAEGLKYASTDEWVRVEGNIATIGVSDYAQDQLSDVVFVEVLVQVGKAVAKGTAVATVESVKAAADVILPVSGKISAINEELSNSPEKVNTDPFGEAWLVKVELEDPGELDALMDTKAYKEYCKSRSH